MRGIVVIPGLLAQPAVFNMAGFGLTQQLLARANRFRLPNQTIVSSLLHYLKLNPISYAYLTALADGLDVEQGVWLRADPILLYPDKTQLFCFSGHGLNIQTEEAKQLVLELNYYYQAEGWTFVMVTPERWYLQLPTLPQIQSYAIEKVAGKPIHDYLLQGADAKRWRVIDNEIQMILYQHSVNQRREQQGMAMINGIWFWGEGQVQGQSSSHPINANFWGQGWLQGLAQHLKQPIQVLPKDGYQWLESLESSSSQSNADNILLLDNLYFALLQGDNTLWQQYCCNYQQQWLQPLQQALKQGKLQQLVLITGHGDWFELNAWHLWRWWRKAVI